MNDDDDINPATIDKDKLNEACAFRAEADRLVDASESLKRSVRGRLDDEADRVLDQAYELRKQSREPSARAFTKTLEAIPERGDSYKKAWEAFRTAPDEKAKMEASKALDKIHETGPALLKKLCNPPVG